MWTYGRDDFEVAEKIRKEVGTHYPNILLEVFVPVVKGKFGDTVVEKPLTPGRLFLRVTALQKEFYEAVKRVSGVGGFLGGLGFFPVHVKSPSSLLFWDRILPTLGDKVKVIAGPLCEATGKVMKCNAERGEVEVALSTFGKLIDVTFLTEEVTVVEEGIQE